MPAVRGRKRNNMNNDTGDNGSDSQQNEASDKEKKTSKRKGPSCHHCRASHIGCDGGRPCANCVRRGKECFNYNSLLFHQNSLGLLDNININRSDLVDQGPRRDSSSSSSSSPFSSPSSPLNDTSTNNNHNSHNNNNNNNNNNGATLLDYNIQLWEVPRNASQMVKAVFIVNLESFRIIGCNDNFLKLCRYSIQAIRDTQLTMFQLIPNRSVPIWNVICQWLGSGSSVKYLENTGMILTGDKQEICLNLKRRFEDGYIWIECEPASVYTDALRVDDVHLPATVRIPCNSALQPIQAPPPSFRYEQLLEILYQKKLVLNDSFAQQTMNTFNNQTTANSPTSVPTSTTSFTSQMLDIIQPQYQPSPPSGILTQQSLFNTIELTRNETEEILHRHH